MSPRNIYKHSLILLAVFIAHKSIAHEVTATNNAGSLTIISPSHLSGQPFSNAKSAHIAFETAGNQQNVTCSETVLSPTTIRLDCNMINGYNGLPRNTTINVVASGATSYSCPPSSWPTHTVLAGTTCNTTTGEHEEEPPPPPTPKPTCSSLTGTDANYTSIESSTQLTQSEIDGMQCIKSAGVEGETATSCHIEGNAGWLESTVYDYDYTTILGYKYSPINGTISGYQCDRFGQPKEGGSHCVASDNGTIKSVSCPDGSAMVVDMGQMTSFGHILSDLESKVNAHNAANLLTDANQDYRMDNIQANVIAAIGSDPQIQALLKGDEGVGCTSQRTGGTFGTPNKVVISCKNGATEVYDGLVGAAGQKGDKGDKGDNGAMGMMGATGTAGTNGTNGTNGTSGQDGLNCTTQQDGVDSIIICADTTSRIEGIDEDGIIAKLQEIADSLLVTIDEPAKFNYDSLIDQAELNIETANEAFNEKVQEIKDEFNALVNISVPAGGFIGCRDIVSFMGNSVSKCFDAYEDDLAVIPLAMLFLFSLIAFVIVVR